MNTKKNSLVLLFPLIFISILFFYSCINSTEPKDTIYRTTDTLTYVQELDNVISELKGSSPELDNNDLQPLSFLGDANLVGLGEATHGTKEFFQLKHRLLKFLVEKHGFKIFGIEADMGESFYIDKYITSGYITGAGNLYSFMKNKMHFWTWKTVEVKNMIEWMRNYNLNKSEDDKLHYFGFDCQYITFHADIIIAYYKKYKPDFVNTVKEKLDLLATLDLENYNIRTSFFKNMTLATKNSLTNNLDELLQFILSQSNELISQSSAYEYRMIKQLIRNSQQTLEVVFNDFHNFTTENLRDKYMAENVAWISSLFGTGTKAVLWAHNGHVENNASLGSGGSMGHRLKQQFSDNYKIVGFSFSEGSFTAVNNSLGFGIQNVTGAPDSSSINYIFYNAKFDNFIFNLADLSDDSRFSNWLNEYRPFRSVGAIFNGNPALYYSNVKLKEYYDVIINYDVTNYAVQL